MEEIALLSKRILNELPPTGKYSTKAKKNFNQKMSKKKKKKSTKNQKLNYPWKK
jgi:hypothetical protein